MQEAPESTKSAAFWRWFTPVIIVLIGLLSLSLSSRRGLFGDELTYHRMSVVLAEGVFSVVSGEAVDGSALLDEVIGTGGFLPGMGILLTPMQLLFGGQAPLIVLRVYVLCINLTLILLIVRELSKIGIRSRLLRVALLVCYLHPFLLAFLSRCWGDVVAMHFGLLFVVTCERMILEEKLHGRYLVRLALLLLAAVMIRPQYLSLAGLALVRLTFDRVETRPPTRSLFHAMGSAAGTTMLIVAPMTLGLFAWNHVLEARFGPVFPVTAFKSMPLFSSEDFVLSAIESQKRLNPAQAVFREVLDRANAGGRTFSAQVDLELESIDELSFEEWRAIKLDSLADFYFWENYYLERILRVGGKRAPPPGSVEQSLLLANTLIWMGVLLLGLIALAAPAYPRNRNYLVPLGLKGLAFLLMVQPLLSRSHGRYYVTLIPVFAILFALTWSQRSTREAAKQAYLSPCRNWVRAGQLFALIYGAALIVCLIYVWFGDAPVPVGVPR